MDTCQDMDNPQNILLRERSQTERSQIIWFHLYKIATRAKSIETECRFVVAGA